MDELPDANRDAARTLDRVRYLSALFAPAAARPALFALAAFGGETARIRDIVREPMLGEIRLQWWHDALSAGPDAPASGNPVLDGVRTAAFRWHLPLAALVRMVEARRLDLYDDPFATLAELEGYAGETDGALTQLTAIVLAEGSDPATGTIAGHAGVAETLVRTITEMPALAARGRCALPLEMLQRHGAEEADVLAGRMTPALAAVLADLAAIAGGHLDAVRAGIGAVPPAVLPAFLPLAPLRHRLQALTRPGRDPFRTPLGPSPLFDQWRLWRVARAPTRRL
jgi:phytoene synthase